MRESWTGASYVCKSVEKDMRSMLSRDWETGGRSAQDRHMCIGLVRPWGYKESMGCLLIEEGNKDIRKRITYRDRLSIGKTKENRNHVMYPCTVHGASKEQKSPQALPSLSLEVPCTMTT
jgi:hypothetical protein